MALNVHKRFRQGQILKLVTSEPISSQDELRRTAEDPVRARAFLLRASLFDSLREAERIL